LVWVAVEEAGQVARVNLWTRKVLRRVNVPGRPHNLTVAPDGTVVTALQGAGTIALFRAGRLDVVELGGSPHDVKVARGIVVVANEGAARLDRVTLKGVVKRSIPLKANPHDLAVFAGGTRAWVSLDGTDDIAMVNLAKRRVIRYLSTAERPHDLLFAPGGEQAWVTDWNGGIHVFSRKGKLLRDIERGVEPHHLTFSPDGDEVWITDHGANRVFVFSTATFELLAERRIAGAPHHVAITPDGKRAVVANHDGGVLAVFNAVTHAKLRAIRVGAGPHGLWAVP
jgi:DNA-binding beta-propeller fold protein YncE